MTENQSTRDDTAAFLVPAIIPAEQFAYVMTSAAEGALRYWAKGLRLVSPKVEEIRAREAAAGRGGEFEGHLWYAAPSLWVGDFIFHVIEDCEEREKFHVIDRERLQIGLNWLATAENGLYASCIEEIAEGVYDDNTVDCLIQAALFGEIRYN